jgi:peptide/nickel transport system permease protein
MTDALLHEADPTETDWAPPRHTKRPVAALLSLGWLALLVALAFLAPWLPFLDDPHQPSLDATQSPSWDHWFGTDQLGRDVFARVIWGARLSLWIAVAAVSIGMLVGGTMGVVGGFLRGWVDTIFATLVNVMLSLPALVLALFIVTVLGQTVRNVILALCVLAIPAIARVIRAQTLTWSNRDFVRAAEILGATRTRMIVRELLPNLAPVIASFALLAVGLVLVAEGGLSFIGISVPPPEITWGRILASGKSSLDDAPHITLSTAAVMFLTLMALNFLGDHILRRADSRATRL